MEPSSVSPGQPPRNNSLRKPRILPQPCAVVPFSPSDQRLAESLASQAAIALTNRMLINQLEELFESFITLINTAIDEKSPYTGGHCQRVPMLTMMLAEAVNETRAGPLADFQMSDKDRYELKIAGLLHDCGKVTTPVHVVDKATKLETIFDRIQLIDTRFEVLKRDAEIDYLKKQFTELFLAKTRDEWCQIMEGTDVCFAPVLSMDEAAAHPHNVERGTFVEVAGITQPAPAPRFSRTPGEISRPPAHVGQHTDEVLTDWLGADADRLASWRDSGAIA